MLTLQQTPLTDYNLEVKYTSLSLPLTKASLMSPKWIMVTLFILGTVISWGVYVPIVHEAGQKCQSSLRAFLLVGVAYFIVAVIVPTIMITLLNYDPTLKPKAAPNFAANSIAWGIAAGTAGAIGAFFIILAVATAGKSASGVPIGPLIVPPLVFAGAPIVNTLATIYFFHPVKTPPDIRFFLGLILAIAGAVLVMVYKPSDAKATPAANSPTPAEQPLAH